MKRTNMNCGICFEPVCTICGLEYLPVISCETKRAAKRQAGKSRR